MSLPRLLKEFHAPGCFTLDEAVTILGAERAREHVRYLLKQGYIETTRRGLYSFLPERTDVLPDRYVLASKATPGGYLSHHTALEVLGVAQTTFTSTLYVTVRTRVAAFAHRGTVIKPLLSTRTVQGHGLLARVKRGGWDLRVAGRELTLVQCLDQLKYAGGLEEVLRSVEGFSSIDWERLELLIEPVTGPYGKASLNAKVGFVVERFSRLWHPPAGLLDRLEQRRGKGAVYLGTSPGRGGHWVPRWHVIVPRSFLEEV